MLYRRMGYCWLVALALVMCPQSAWATDTDGDGIADAVDNCVLFSNADQADADGDGVGDACVTTDGTGNRDDDNDAVDNYKDNCIKIANQNQTDTDGDGLGDPCDDDDDNDGKKDYEDNCPLVSNPGQQDTNADGQGDACDPDDGLHDADGDTVDDEADNCPGVANKNQLDGDHDGIGDACDNDLDNDQIKNAMDNCPEVPNPDQKDTDADGKGDACDGSDDADGDGISDSVDNCPYTPNANQANSNSTPAGDACEFVVDSDGDGLPDAEEVAASMDPNDRDMDGDGIWDGVDENPSTADNTYGGCTGWSLDPKILSGTANVIFVDPCTSYNPGVLTRDQAKNTNQAVPTLADAARIWQAGDTIYMRGRLHYVSDFGLPALQNPSTPVVITSYPGEQAALTGMVYARNWRYAYTRTAKDATGIVREYDVYKKRFARHNLSVSRKWLHNGVSQVTALAGCTGSRWRVAKEGIAFFGLNVDYPVGQYYGQTAAHSEYLPYAPDVPCKAGDTTTTLYICLPAGYDSQGHALDSDPDGQNSAMLVSDHHTLACYSSAGNYILDGLRLTRGEMGVDVADGIVTMQNCIIEDMQSQGVLAGREADRVVVTNCIFNRIGSTGWDHGLYMGDPGGDYSGNQFTNVSGTAIKLCRTDTKAHSNLIGPALPAVYRNVGMTRAGFVDAGTGANLIYNNVVWGSHRVGLYTYSCNGSQYFNNVFYGVEQWGLAADAVENGVPLAQNLGFHNNIIVPSATAASDFKFVINASANPTISHNTYYGTGGFTGYTPGADSPTTDPLFVDPANNDFHLQCDSPAIDVGLNTVVTGASVTADLDGQLRIVRTVDMGAYEQPIYVDVNASGTETGSCSRPFNTIQEGIDAASGGGLVLVRAGTYRDDGNRDIDFGGEAITVRSVDGPATTIVDGTDAPNYRGFYFHTQETSSSILQGFTIQNITCDWGAAIHVAANSSPTIRNCILQNNAATTSGGGIYIAGNPAIINCAILNNTAQYGAGIRVSGGSPSFINCTVAGNTATDNNGHGLYYGGPSNTITIRNSIFWNATPTSEFYGSGLTLDVQYSDIQGGFTGTGNRDDSPNLVNGYELSSTSPCIDVGNNASVADIATTDIVGNARITDGPDTDTDAEVDMGAYEYQP